MFTSPLISQLDNHHHRRHFIFLFNKFRCPVGQRINKVTLKNMAASMEGTWEEVLSSIDNLLMETEIQKMRAHCSISVIQNIECFQFVWKNRIFRQEKKCNCSFFRCKLKKREKLSETFLFSRFLPESLEYHGAICLITSFMLMAAFFLQKNRTIPFTYYWFFPWKALLSNGTYSARSILFHFSTQTERAQKKIVKTLSLLKGKKSYLLTIVTV